jgi:NTE family protein
MADEPAMPELDKEPPVNPGSSPLDAPLEGVAARALLDGPGLCLSGGGSRAMLFHAGALMRLNELGLLAKTLRISSVSGGSIAAGVLGTRWSQLVFDPVSGVAPDFEKIVVAPIRRFARKNIDIALGVKGVLLPGGNPAARFARVLDEELFHGATLQALPGMANEPAKPGTPRFVFNATNLQSGSLWRFSKPYTWDWRVGQIKDPSFLIGTAVAASSAFPPFFAPLVLDLNPSDFVPGSGDPKLVNPTDYQRKVLLADGGVYDNLGLETVFKECRVVLVSDGGGKLGDDAKPPTDWPRETLRVMKIIDNGVRNLRKRQVIDVIESEGRDGAYWGIRSSVSESPAAGALYCDPVATRRLAEMPTRLAKVDDPRQAMLINWGYAIADAAVRHWYLTGATPPGDFPLPGGVG